MHNRTENGTKSGPKCYCFVLFVSCVFVLFLSPIRYVAASYSSSSSSLNDFLGYDSDDNQNRHHEHDDQFTTDIAIKLKREYSDDLVSDLFAASYDLVKVARVNIYIL